MADRYSLYGTLQDVQQRLGDTEDFEHIIQSSHDVNDPIRRIGAVQGVRAALEASIAENSDATVIVVTSSGRQATQTAEEIRSWYKGNPDDIAVLDAWETLPHERLSPRADTVARRMAIFRRLVHPDTSIAALGALKVLVMPVRSLIQPIVSGVYDIEPLIFKRGDIIDMNVAVSRLIEHAYTRSDLVMERGEFAVRGGILDIFPPTAAHPVRIDFFGDEIDEIHEFHASDQRTYGDNIESIWATACREIPLTDNVRERAHKLIGSIDNADDMLESIAQGIPVEGMESLIPALIDDVVPVYSLFPESSVVLVHDEERIRRAAEDLNKTAQEFLAASWHVAASRGASAVPISFDKASFIDFNDVLSDLDSARHHVWMVSDLGVDDSVETNVVIHASQPDEYRGDEKRTNEGIESLQKAGLHIIITSPATGTLARLQRIIGQTNADSSQIDFILSHVTRGFIDNQAGIAVLTEQDITGRSSVAAQTRTPSRRRKAIDLVELKPGDFVVHEQHGIGQFVELQQRTVGLGNARSQREYVVLEYASSKRGAPHDKLFVPADQLDQLSKYIGAEIPKLNKLGGSDWATTKAKARKKVKEIAQDLVALYSTRQRTRGYAFSPDTPWQRELEEAFPYQETPDQLTTIDDVKTDMEKPIPMDRLICGDVGFGKTEIAIRAAFKAVQDSKQVAVLVPTTLLAQQHYETFSSRYDGFPVKVAIMSRFQTAKELKATIADIEAGTVDVVIGTHKLLNPAIKFKDLGLVIIDEEQRFGVEHKETLKALRTNVDVLSLSATPIPRTLEMSITGLREMSTLATPPEDRLPVLTYVGAYEDAQVVAAVRREILREGQVFYVHNRVQDIDKQAQKIRELIPEARVATAHGKMSEKQLDLVIQGFWNREIDVLVCTTIVETGLDISNANTLIVDRADRFGLSQLHQLRGRVGRGRERAYAYFLYDATKTMTQTAHDRLSTIAQNTQLGAGYDVAMKDLELRGTGNLLGGEQSGHIEGVGFDLYVRMVSEAVMEYKEPERKESVAVSIDLPVEASIPQSYIDSDKLRLEAYRKIAAARTEEEFSDIRDELKDRYGNLPHELGTLFDIARLRSRARNLGISDLIAQGKNIRIVGIDPQDSVMLRLKRIYKNVQYRPVTHTLILPTPFQGMLGQSAMQTDEVLRWTNQLLDDLEWKHVSDKA
ncbi:transcription-repair coupling factor [Alloscardovia theropitheci]|uniref:Transcription-repair-coupling factor n=1 Tax=Alloscardovia theropitheci TaxID=2496842 RepID=A0A4R0QUA0_9BIFI|nr:transcription-repair coupling factor [Alloscardovia theropitheci]TCD53527.1 transcription-repair coupling factor [Alloscardovia theropitheci]